MTAEDSTVIAKTVTRIVVPIILLLAVTLLLQGHNAPGGGFIAGVLTAAAFALIYIIYGLHYVEREVFDRSFIPVELPVSPTEEEGPKADTIITKEFGEVFALGLAIAAGSGIVAILLGAPFLTQGILFVDNVPIYHVLEFASAVVFDIGVYLVVVGGIMTVLAVVGAE